MVLYDPTTKRNQDKWHMSTPPKGATYENISLMITPRRISREQNLKKPIINTICIQKQQRLIFQKKK